MITYSSGDVYQTLAYAPHGENLINAKNDLAFLNDQLVIMNQDYAPMQFTGYEKDEESGLSNAGARMYDSKKDIFYSTEPRWPLYPWLSPYVHCGNNPIRYIDPDGNALRLANVESFNVLLSSLPAEARSMITMGNNNFINAGSVNAAYSQFGNSGNLQALRDIVSDERIVDFNATAPSFSYVNAKTGQTETSNFQQPSRANVYQELLSEFSGTSQEKLAYSQHLLRTGFVDEVEVSGNFGATLRPANAQQPYPGGQVSTTNNFEVYVNSVGTTPTEKAKNVGHELFGHLYFFFMGKDPRHHGASGNLGGSPLLDQQIINRERESEINSQNQ
jgi:RHS repeat-associated protein